MISSMIGRTLAANWGAFAFRTATPRFAAWARLGLPAKEADEVDEIVLELPDIIYVGG
jgi:hypothetical protein